MVQVLFVCLGNICRSPMVEAVFRKMVNDEGLENEINVDSAGTASWHTGKPPHEGTRDILDRYDITYKGMKARQLMKEDADTVDYLIVMDDQNMRDVKDILEKEDQVVIKKLTDFVDDPEATYVPDPYYTGDFDYTYELVCEGAKNLLMYIKDKHNM